MRKMSFLVLLCFIIASAIPDLLLIALSEVKRLHLIPYQYRDYVGYLDATPWQPLVFGMTFGLVAAITNEAHQAVAKEEVFGYVLIIALIFVILQYGGIFLVPLLSAAHIDFYVFAKTMAALFIALVTWKGLHVPLEGLGVFLVTLIALVMSVLVVAGLPFPVSPDTYWFTIIGSTMGLKAAFSRA